MLKLNNQYVFILCPNHSGSTLLYFLMDTSPYVSVLKDNDEKIIEGQIAPKIKYFMPYAKESDKGIFYLHKKIYKCEKNYNWNKIKEIWKKYWDLEKPVLIEKSTTNLYRKNILKKNFKNCKFLLMIRNPYAVCESIKRKHKTKVEDSIKHWIDTTEQQMKNLKDNDVLYFTYEELCQNTEKVIDKIIKFIPQIKNLNYKSFLNRPRYENIFGLQNQNEFQIKNLSKKEINIINKSLSYKIEMLNYFKYNLI